MTYYRKSQHLTQAIPVFRIWFAYLYVVCVVFCVFTPKITMAQSVTTNHLTECQLAKLKIQEHFKKERAIRDKVVIFSKLDEFPLLQTEIEIAYLGIERELLALAAKGILHTCDFNDLSDAGLSITVSDDGRFHTYRWATDYEVSESTGYTYIMYAQRKNPDFEPAEYRSRDNYSEFTQLITIPKPKEVSADTYTDFPIYGVVYRNYLRGNQKIHCEPNLMLYRVEQNKRFGYITTKGFRFLDTEGKPIDKSRFFTNGCDNDTHYKLDNQFSYNEKTQILSFHLAVLNSYSEETGMASYTNTYYQFYFNGKDFVQIAQPK